MGIFAKDAQHLWHIYQCGIKFRGEIAGGVPRDPNVTKNWLKKKTGVTVDAELKNMVVRTLQENGEDIGIELSDDEMIAMFDSIAETHTELTQTNGFKKDENGLYIESRCLKAAIKESVNTLYAQERRGPTRKGAKNFFAERVFVEPERIYFGVHEPDGIGTQFAHVNTARGKQASITRYEYIEEAEITFYVGVLLDQVTYREWVEIWTHIEQNGIGAMRSQGKGKSDIALWSDVTGDPIAHHHFSRTMERNDPDNPNRFPRALTTEELLAQRKKKAA